MINLMPKDIKQDRAYGRSNVLLLKWTSQIAVAYILLIIALISGYSFMVSAQRSVNNSKKRVEETIKNEKLDQTEKEYSSFASNVKTVTQILSKQLIYSSLLQQIGSVTPNGATLSSVSISSAANALDLNFNIASSDIAPIIQLNLQDEKNKLFQKADIIQVSCQQSNEAEKCTTQLKAEYKKDAKFLFINTIGTPK